MINIDEFLDQNSNEELQKLADQLSNQTDLDAADALKLLRAIVSDVKTTERVSGVAYQVYDKVTEPAFLAEQQAKIERLKRLKEQENAMTYEQRYNRALKEALRQWGNHSKKGCVTWEHDFDAEARWEREEADYALGHKNRDLMFAILERLRNSTELPERGINAKQFKSWKTGWNYTGYDNEFLYDALRIPE